MTRLAFLGGAIVVCSCYSPVAATGSAETGGAETGADGATAPAESTSSGLASSDADERTTSGVATQADSSDATGSYCGNGIVENGELCDDGENQGSYGGCGGGCTELGPHCGDGIINGAEACDEGDGNINGMGCNDDCVISGSVLWTLEYDTELSGIRAIYDVAIADDDSFVAVGGQDVAGERRGWIRAYDGDGNSMWSQLHARTPGDFNYRAVAVDPSGGIAAAGTGPGPGPGQGWMASVRKYDPLDGAAVWTDDLDDGYADQGLFGLAADADGYFVEVGAFDREIFVRRLHPDGHEVWRRIVTSFDQGAASGVAIDGEGNILCVGNTGEAEGQHIWIRKYDPNGTTLWTQIPPQGPSASGRDVAVDDDGNVLVVADLGLDGPLLLKIDGGGDTVWSSDIFAGEIEKVDGMGVATDSAGNVIVAGKTKPGLGDLAVAKYDETGLLLWAEAFTDDHTGSMARDVATDSDDNIVVVGAIAGASWIAKVAR